MTTRRWCLKCFEDFAEDISWSGLCMACDYEHDRTVALRGVHFSALNKVPTPWWGPTLYDVDAEDDPADIQHDDGFHDSRGNRNARGLTEAWGDDGTVRDPWIGGAWRGCHSCGEFFQESVWPSSPRCGVCEGD